MLISVWSQWIYKGPKANSPRLLQFAFTWHFISIFQHQKMLLWQPKFESRWIILNLQLSHFPLLILSLNLHSRSFGNSSHDYIHLHITYNLVSQNNIIFYLKSCWKNNVRTLKKHQVLYMITLADTAFLTQYISLYKGFHLICLTWCIVQILQYHLVFCVRFYCLPNNLPFDSVLNNAHIIELMFRNAQSYFLCSLNSLMKKISIILFSSLCMAALYAQT
jgi:hypothetical protein